MGELADSIAAHDWPPPLPPTFPAQLHAQAALSHCLYRQLPPVKDHRCYDWAGCMYKVGSRRQQALVGAPVWQLRGIRDYMKFEDVFFLDRVERVSATEDDSAAEREEVEYFKQLQLRARDGELDDADYQYIFNKMDLQSRLAGGEFSGTDVYRLVTTRKRRDELNAAELDAAIKRGVPAKEIAAIHSPPNSRVVGMSTEDVGLPSSLILCIGARVMVTHNISVPLGLVNGTVGIVHDIICNASGLASSVLIRVRRGGKDRDGYRGPSFLDQVQMREAGLDPDQEAVVALCRWSAEVWDGGNMYQRQQFPLMCVALTLSSQPCPALRAAHHGAARTRCARRARRACHAILVSARCFTVVPLNRCFTAPQAIVGDDNTQVAGPHPASRGHRRRR